MCVCVCGISGIFAHIDKLNCRFRVGYSERASTKPSHVRSTRWNRFDLINSGMENYRALGTRLWFPKIHNGFSEFFIFVAHLVLMNPIHMYIIWKKGWSDLFGSKRIIIIRRMSTLHRNEGQKCARNNIGSKAHWNCSWTKWKRRNER